jgi:two-component system cell cycle sensor histidine kinase/response regulator CckA
VTSTDQKTIEKTLRDSEERYRATIDAMDEFVHVIDRNLRIVLSNEAFREIITELDLGHDLVGKELFEAFPFLPDRVREEYERVLETGEPLVTEESTEVGPRTVWTSTRKIPILDERGKVDWILTIVRDVTERRRAEEALQESEEKYRALAETSPNGIFISDAERFVYVNQRLCEISSFSRDELLSMPDPVGALFVPEDQERLLAYASSRLSGGSAPTKYRARAIRKDGEEIWLELSMSSIILFGRKVLQGNVEDITERKRTEEGILRLAALQEALNAIIAAAVTVSSLSEFLEIVLDHTLAALGLEMGGIWIPPYAALRGLSTEIRTAMRQLASDATMDITGPEVVEDWQQVAIDSQYSAIRPNMTRFGICASLTVPCLAEGRRIGGVSLAAPEPRSWSPEEIGLVEAVGRQLGGAAERLRLTDRIRQQAQRMQQVIDTVPEGVILLDTDRRIILANPVAEKDLITLADAEAGGILTHLGDRPLAELLTSPPRGLWHEVTADGRIFQVIARPIENGPTPTGWVMVIRDVTQQREVERHVRQQERLAAVGQLAAGIAHDFNNIIAAIVLYAQMTARMEGLPAIVRERMETIDGQAKHATNLIQQVLDFSRRAVLERRPLDLAPLLKEHIRLLKRTLPESIEIRLDYEPDEYATPFTVNADPTRMQQMVTNLALNARDAMRSGGELNIRLERVKIKPEESPLLLEMEAGEWVRMTVSDTGTGIPPDVLSHIFEPFFTTKERGRGSGLGLAQVHGIVAQHEGRIDVETQVGKGTTFTIYLPVYLSEPSPVLPSAELSVLPTGQGETILVVEDDAVVQKALADSLELLNYQVRRASNGQEALAVLEQRKGEIALVLSDVVMPGMGGIALLHALRERRLGVPVVMLTGHAIQREMEELRAQGMIDWLPKPPQLEQLAKVVARILGAA